MNDTPKKVCMKCSAPLDDTHRFCPRCGYEGNHPANDEVLNYGSCPSCGRCSCLRVVSSTKPRRRLKCKFCKRSFESVEVLRIHPDAFKLAEAIVADPRLF